MVLCYKDTINNMLRWRSGDLQKLNTKPNTCFYPDSIKSTINHQKVYSPPGNCANLGVAGISQEKIGE